MYDVERVVILGHIVAFFKKGGASRVLLFGVATSRLQSRPKGRTGLIVVMVIMIVSVRLIAELLALKMRSSEPTARLVVI